ncbi:hypothetical protein Runsl_3766 [Runella slithyformis DSM 19594]|uniref:Uncharacterized protein n=1 Tax=Runella slithyformis (strain ATCC 29530 / DSM 19594 / LMG 11500 / NCIMB 11436 / LSU 4) TaxID=761193 RepID=A0A7U4E786_RUNSL|nr:hypothetical protein Runsl_3766 [Runella slithyformis DSM 19594]
MIHEKFHASIDIKFGMFSYLQSKENFCDIENVFLRLHGAEHFGLTLKSCWNQRILKSIHKNDCQARLGDIKLPKRY